MFKCQKCKEQSQPGVKQQKQVVEEREKMYRNEEGLMSKGREIVKEIVVCSECATA